jgi:stalled ribosome rescue protein Dom34
MRLVTKEKDWIKIIPESLEDLWFLYNRIDGKVVEQKSLRAKKIKRGNEIIKGKKVLREIAIKVEKKHWEDDKIKVIGKILEGEDKNKYHSFYLELEKKIKIKDFPNKLPKKEDYKIFVCLVNKEQALFGAYRLGKIKVINKILAKGREEEFYKEVSNKLKKEKEMILIAGPGNVKDRIVKLTEKEMFVDNIYNINEKGFEELLKRQSIKNIIKKLREERERKLVEKFLVELKKNPEKVCYGEEVEKNVERIKDILILSDKIPKYEKVLEEIENKGGVIRIVDSNKDYVQEIKNFEIIGVCRW